MPTAQGVKVRVGVGVILRRSDNTIAVGERLGSHGANRLALPGGHLEMYETWEDCARREVLEETGLSVETLRHVATTNDMMPDDGKHYITIFMLAEAPDGHELQNLEPHKCVGWEWRTWESLQAEPKERLFVPLVNLLSGGLFDPRGANVGARAAAPDAAASLERLEKENAEMQAKLKLQQRASSRRVISYSSVE